MWELGFVRPYIMIQINQRPPSTTLGLETFHTADGTLVCGLLQGVQVGTLHTPSTPRYYWSEILLLEILLELRYGADTFWNCGTGRGLGHLRKCFPLSPAPLLLQQQPVTDFGWVYKSGGGTGGQWKKNAHRANPLPLSSPTPLPPPPHPPSSPPLTFVSTAA